MKQLIALLVVLLLSVTAVAQSPVELFDGITPTEYADDDGVQRFNITCPDSFYTIWWLHPDSLPDSAFVTSYGPVTDFTFTIQAATDTFDVNDQMVGEWFGETAYQVGFIAYKYVPIDWDVNDKVYSQPYLFRLNVNKPASPELDVLFSADP